MTRFITILFSVFCVAGFCVSVVMWSAEDSRTYSTDEAFIQFLQHGFDFQISPWFLLAAGFMLCSVFWICRLFLMRRDHTPNKSPEPTAVGAVSSAVAVHATSRRWLSFFR